MNERKVLAKWMVPMYACYASQMDEKKLACKKEQEWNRKREMDGYGARGSKAV